MQKSNLLPPANKVCEGYVLHVSVCPQGGSSGPQPGGVWGVWLGGVSRPTVRGEVEGSGWGSSGPHPVGSPGPHPGGSPGPHLGGLQVPTWGMSPGPHPRGSPGPHQGGYPSMHWGRLLQQTATATASYWNAFLFYFHVYTIGWKVLLSFLPNSSTASNLGDTLKAGKVILLKILPRIIYKCTFLLKSIFPQRLNL